MPETRHFENIDLLRAWAALSVLGFHAVELGASGAPGPWSPLRAGWVGVDLFFVISGFVIGWSALKHYADSPRTFRREYWRRRLLRIMPLYVVVLAAWILVFHPGTVQTPRQLAWQLGTHLTFTHSFWASTFGALDGPTWSLAIEMQFYLLVAVAVPWLSRAPSWRIIAYGFAIAWGWRALGVMLYSTQEALFRHSVQLPGTLDEFALGIALAKGMVGMTSDRSRERAWIGAGACCGVIAVITMAAFATDYWRLPAMVVFWRTCAAVFFSGLVAAAVVLPQRLARRELRPLAYLGKISYGIYLWHMFAVLLLAGMATTGVLLAATVLMTTAMAAASWHFLEKPFMSRVPAVHGATRSPMRLKAQGD